MFYPAIIAASIWICINIVKIKTYTEELKAEYPNCTASNPNQIMIIMVSIVCLIFTQKPIEHFFKAVFMKLI